jgi:hypothetical protein
MVMAILRASVQNPEDRPGIGPILANEFPVQPAADADAPLAM